MIAKLYIKTPYLGKVFFYLIVFGTHVLSGAILQLMAF